MAAARHCNVGCSLAAARRQWQRQRRWRQRNSGKLAVAAARHPNVGGSCAEAATVAAARQRDVGGSLAVAWRQWQRQRRWRQRDSATSAVVAARQQDVVGSLAAARRQWQSQRRWRQREARRRCTAQWPQHVCVVGIVPQRSRCNLAPKESSRCNWRQRKFLSHFHFPLRRKP